MGGGAEEMAEGTRDTGFMLEWMFFTEGAAVRLYYLLFSQKSGRKKREP